MLLKHQDSSSWYGKGDVKNKIINLFKIAKKNLNKDVNQRNCSVVLLPHAGIDYSGYCSAGALQHFLDANLKPKYNNLYTNIVILSTSHKYSSNLIFPSGHNHYGIFNKISINNSKINSYISKNSNCELNDKFFLEEHSHKNVIPFLEYCFPNTPITPILVGDLNNYSKVGNNLYNHFNTNKTLWVLSTDLSHVNGRFSHKVPTLNINNNIRKLESQLLYNLLNRSSLSHFTKNLKTPSICGINVLKLFLSMPFKPIIGKVCCYYHSNQKSSIFKNEIVDKDVNSSIVSYCSVIFVNRTKKYNINTLFTRFEELELLHYIKNILSKSLRDLIEQYIFIQSPLFYVNKGIFVTLKINGRLRGCIGTFSLNKSIIDNVYTYTLSAGFSDSRFVPLQKKELKLLSYSITLLDEKKQIDNTSSGLHKWKLGKDGIILECNKNHAIYLPQVPSEQKWNKKQTLEHLRIKAGLKTSWTDKKCSLFTIPGYEIL